MGRMKNPAISNPFPFLALVFVLLIAPASAGEPPTGFRSLRWGASVEEAKKVFPNAKCLSSKGKRGESDSGDASCLIETTIGSAKVKVLLEFFEKPTTPKSARGFQSYAITYKSKDFSEIREALSTRYGNPATTNEEPIQTRSGLKDTNTILLWKLETCSIQAMTYAGSILEGMASVSTKSWTQEFERRRKARSGESGKDL